MIHVSQRRGGGGAGKGDVFLRLAWPTGLVLVLVNNMVNTDAFIPEHSHLSGPERENKYW